MASIQLIMFLIISLYVASSSAAGNTLSYDEITQFSGTLGAQVGPIIFGLLTLMASIWLAIKVRVTPHTHGLVLGVVLLLTTVILDAIFSPSVVLYEHIGNTIVIPIAWFGAYRGGLSIKTSEAVYRTSQSIRGADRSGIGKAIGEQLSGSLISLIAFVDKDGSVDTASAWTSSSNQKIPSSISSLQSPPKAESVLRGSDLSLRESNIHSLLVLPLSQMDETLIIGSRSRDGFSRKDIQNYLTIAEQVALSLENLKLVEQAHLTGITEERQRLAAEIHDSLTQGFISIVTLTEIAEARLENYPQDLRGDFQPLLNQARQTARDNLTAARKMTWAMRPDLQEGMPLADALAKLGRRWADANDTPVSVSSSGDARQLHPDIETALLRTTREALNNIQKHAQATQVTITLTYMGSLVALDVQDNGKGFDTDKQTSDDAGSGFGLKSIDEQVKQLGGELTVESRVNKGTTIAVSLPIV